MNRLLPLATLAATAALAHPLGREEHSLSVGVEVGDEGLHAVVIGEVPLTTGIAALGKRAKGARPTPEQVAAYTAERQAEIGAGTTISIDGTPMPVTWAPAASALNGRAVDGFFVYVVEATVPPDKLDHDMTVRVEQTTWSEVETVYQWQVRPLAGWTVSASDAPRGWVGDDAARNATIRFVKP